MIERKRRKITDKNIETIIEMRKQGYSQRYIAEQIGCSTTTVRTYSRCSLQEKIEYKPCKEVMSCGLRVPNDERRCSGDAGDWEKAKGKTAEEIKQKLEKWEREGRLAGYKKPNIYSLEGQII